MIFINYLKKHEQNLEYDELIKYTYPGDARSLSRSGLLLSYIFASIKEKINNINLEKNNFKMAIYSIQEPGPINFDVASSISSTKDGIDTYFKKNCEPKQHLKSTSIISIAHLGKILNCLGPLYLFNSPESKMNNLFDQIEIDFKVQNLEHVLICSVLSNEDRELRNHIQLTYQIPNNEEICNCFLVDYSGLQELKKLFSKEKEKEKENLYNINLLNQWAIRLLKDN